MQKSTNGGASWSGPTIVDNQSVGDQFWPNLAFDSSTGTLAVIYYDSRADSGYSVNRPPGNDASTPTVKNVCILNGVGTQPCDVLNTYIATSTNGGANWSPTKVSSVGDQPGYEMFNNRTQPVSVTPNLGIVELILSGTGTVEGFGAATEVVGLVQDHAVTPCGAGSYSDTASRRVVMHGGVLILHEAGMTCMTASGLQARATYQVDGQASTGIFAGARGTGDVTVDVATHQETLSGKLILAPAAA